MDCLIQKRRKKEGQVASCLITARFMCRASADLCSYITAVCVPAARETLGSVNTFQFSSFLNSSFKTHLFTSILEWDLLATCSAL